MLHLLLFGLLGAYGIRPVFHACTVTGSLTQASQRVFLSSLPWRHLGSMTPGRGREASLSHVRRDEVTVTREASVTH